MKYVVFVSIDEPERWSTWHSGNTDQVYYSNFFDTKEEVHLLLNRLKDDYPDSNLMDGKCNHKFYIQYTTLLFDESDQEGFKILKRMMRAYKQYEMAHNKEIGNEEKKKCVKKENL